MSAIPGYITIHEFAARLNIQHSMAARYVREGRITAVTIGNQKLIPIEAVATFERRRPGRPARKSETSAAP